MPSRRETRKKYGFLFPRKSLLEAGRSHIGHPVSGGLLTDGTHQRIHIPAHQTGHFSPEDQVLGLVDRHVRFALVIPAEKFHGVARHPALGIGFLHRIEDTLVDFQAVFGQVAGQRINFSQADFLSRPEREGRPAKIERPETRQ